MRIGSGRTPSGRRSRTLTTHGEAPGPPAATWGEGATPATGGAAGPTNPSRLVRGSARRRRPHPSLETLPSRGSSSASSDRSPRLPSPSSPGDRLRYVLRAPAPVQQGARLLPTLPRARFPPSKELRSPRPSLRPHVRGPPAPGPAYPEDAPAPGGAGRLPVPPVPEDPPVHAGDVVVAGQAEGEVQVRHQVPAHLGDAVGPRQGQAVGVGPPE